MTTMALWATSDKRPRFAVISSNLIDEDLAEPSKWDAALDKLRCWASDPGTLDDEGFEAPSTNTIQLALNLALQRRERGVPPPTRVMPNGEAGVALEWVVGSFRNLWEIDDQNRLEMSRFEAGRCVSRDEFDLSGLSF